jgi:vacuolar-type H+-ATPase subunit I/STV1
LSNKNIIILSIIVGTIFALLSFVLGVSLGVSNDQDTLLKFAIPILGVMGNWVAGFGAIFAVFTALWLADQQRKRDSENLKLAFSVYISPGILNPYLAVIITSNGNKPSKLNSISIHSKNSKVALAIMHLDSSGHQLPMQLSYGEQATCILIPKSESSINDFVKDNCSGIYKNLHLNVNTTTRNFTTPFSSAVIEHLKKC